MRTCDHPIFMRKPWTYLEMKRWRLNRKEKISKWWNRVPANGEGNGIRLGGVPLYQKQKEGVVKDVDAGIPNISPETEVPPSHDRRVSAGFNATDAEKEESTKTAVCLFFFFFAPETKLIKFFSSGVYGLLSLLIAS